MLLIWRLIVSTDIILVKDGGQRGMLISVRLALGTIP